MTQIVKKQLILLMIPNQEKHEAISKRHDAKSKGRRWHYLAVKELSALLRAISLKNNGNFYCLNCLYSFRTKNKLELYKKACENKDFCNVIMPSENAKIELNQYQISDKSPFFIYGDLECIIEKIDVFKNNPQNSSATKVRKHISSGFSMSTILPFKSIQNRMMFIEVKIA